MTDARTPYGVIHFGGACRDDYPTIRLYDQPPRGGAPVKLQRPALRALRAAETRYGKRTGRPNGWRAIALTGSWRSCAYQRQLYARDPRRYAHPNATAHTRGLAIDVSTAQPNQAIIRACLRAEGWRQVRPDDEPWHYSYWIET